jgi:5'-nucleotidase
MKLLLTNDDGIYAPGIQVLYDGVRELGDIEIVAPESERSAVGHAITLVDPLKTRRVKRDGDFSGYAVSGTPADCVKLAVCGLLESPPDLILSGVNLGPNAGISVLYSGTVSAATEGIILGIPSMAISLCTFVDPCWDTARRVAHRLISLVTQHPIPENTLLNVNIPNVPYEQIKGLKITTMGRSRFVEVFHKRQDPRGNTYYWLDGDIKQLGPVEGTDLEALEEGFISLSPIQFDMTHYAVMDQLHGWVDDWSE